MKSYAILFTVIMAIVAIGCNRESVEPIVGNDIDSNNLSFLAERFISIKQDQQIFVDTNSNEYLDLFFDYKQLSHIIGIYLEKDKKYHFSLLGDNSTLVDFVLLKSNRDTLFVGEDNWLNGIDKYISWKSDVNDTFYVSLRYNSDINFHIKNYRLTIEDMSERRIESNDIKFICSGNWFINKSGYLSLVCHQTNIFKWAKIVDDSLQNYSFTYQFCQASGRPDNHIGIECYAAESIFDFANLSWGYLFDVVGPASWMISYWHKAGDVGFEYGYTKNNLSGNWNSLELNIFGDSIGFSVNNENVKRLRNLSYTENGLYIVVTDTKQDTIIFRDILLENKN
jgi:hypothetical protein